MFENIGAHMQAKIEITYKNLVRLDKSHFLNVRRKISNTSAGLHNKESASFF